MILPSAKRIEYCRLMGWQYLGDGIFCRDELLGYFTTTGFVKE